MKSMKHMLVSLLTAVALLGCSEYEDSGNLNEGTTSDTTAEAVEFRDGCLDECIMKYTWEDKQAYLAYDCSLGTMLACLEQGLLDFDQCAELIKLQGGQLDTYWKYQSIVAEVTPICEKICG